MPNDHKSDHVLIRVKNVSINFRMSPPGMLKGEVIRLLRSKPRRQGNTSGELLALRDVSLTLRQGDFLGIVGNNGAGKSTLLKTIVGIYPPTNGSVERYGTIYPLLQLGLGFNPEMTGEENAFLAMAFFGMGKKQVAPLLDEVFEFSELQDFRLQPLKMYSGGMIARLAFTLATTVTPDILILDEVFAAGDVHWTQRALRRLEKKIDAARALVMVSHSMDTVRKYCNRCIWMANGQVVDEGGPEVVDKYEGRASAEEVTKVVREFVSKQERPKLVCEINFDPPHEKMGVLFHRVFVANSKSQPASEISMSEDFFVVFELSVPSAVPDLHVGFRLFSDRRLLIMQANSVDNREIHGQVGTSGYHKIQARIPGNLLPPRGYGVEISIWSPVSGHEHHYRNEHVLEFNIVGNELIATGEEALRPLLDWQAETLLSRPMRRNGSISSMKDHNNLHWGHESKRMD